MFSFLASFLSETVLYVFLALSFLLTIVTFIPLIPSHQKPLISMASVVLMLFSSYNLGILSEKRKYEYEIAQQKIYIAELEAKAAKETIKIVTEYVDKVKIIKEKGEKIYEQVPVYISKESDDKCILPNGFVIMHDSAVRNELPESTGDANEEASGIKLSEATKTITLNYLKYHELVEQLTSLQSWVKKIQETYNVKK